MKLIQRMTIVLIGLLVCVAAQARHQTTSNQFITARASISQVAAQNPKLTTLAVALNRAGLARMLNSRGPFTVFAPTNKAFSRLPQGTLQALLSNKRQLKTILKYHVVKGRLPASALYNGERLRTLQGNEIVITKRGRRIYVNNAQIVVENISARNGIIHLINRVITPTTTVTTTR